MGESIMPTKTTKMYSRNLLIKIFGATFILAQCVLPLHARTFPRSSPVSFRFPSSMEEDYHIEKSRTSLFPKSAKENDSSFNVENTQGRSADIISLDSNPIKPAIPQSSRKPSKSDDDDDDTHDHDRMENLSSEISEDNLSIPDKGKNNNDHDPEEEVLREALCPQQNSSFNEADIPPSSSIYKLRYDLKAGKCAHVGKREHCGENMIFVAEIDSAAYGYCECDFENKVLRKEIKQAALLTKTPLVFHLKTNACYRLYEKAYCNEGEWLVLSREKKGPVCEPHRCSSLAVQRASRRRASKLLTPSFWTDTSNSNPKMVRGDSSEWKAAMNMNGSSSAHVNGKPAIWVPLNGTGPCVKLFESNSRFCEEDEQVIFNVGDIVPSCGYIGRRVEGRAIIRNACPPGSYYSIIGRCQPDWDF